MEISYGVIFTVFILIPGSLCIWKIFDMMDEEK